MAKIVNAAPAAPDVYPNRQRGPYTKTDYTTSGHNFVVLNRESLGYDPGGAFCVHQIHVNTTSGTWGLDVLTDAGDWLTLSANTANADSAMATFRTRGYRQIRLTFSAAYGSEATINVMSTFAGLTDA